MWPERHAWVCASNATDCREGQQLHPRWGPRGIPRGPPRDGAEHPAVGNRGDWLLGGGDGPWLRGTRRVHAGPLPGACREPRSPTVGSLQRTPFSHCGGGGLQRTPPPLPPGQALACTKHQGRAARAGEGLVLEDDPADKAETGSASGSESVLTSATLPPTPSPAAETRGAEPGRGDTPA